LAYKLKMDFTVRVMDLFLYAGEEILISVLFNVIRLTQDTILRLEDEKLFRYLLEDMINNCCEEFHISTLLCYC